MPQSCKQAGTKDFGVYVITFAVAIAFGKKKQEDQASSKMKREHI